MKKLTRTVLITWRRVLSCLKDYRFSSILVKYFLLLFLSLMMPMVILSIWYGNKLKENLQNEMIKLNETSLNQAFDNVNSIILSIENLAYTLSTDETVRYLAAKTDLKAETNVYLDNLRSSLSLLMQANDYIDSFCIYFRKSDSVVSDKGINYLWEYDDQESLQLYSIDMKPRSVLHSRKLNGKYPYLLTVLYPISASKSGNNGGVAININVESLGEYIGRGDYRNKDYSSTLLVLDEKQETLVYSDEYRLLREGVSSLGDLKSGYDWSEGGTQICNIWGQRYVVNGIQTEKDRFWYVYISPLSQFDKQNLEMNHLLRNIIILISLICLILAIILAVWVYKPIRHTMHVLDNMSMLTQWDKKEHVDEIEMIQRSILSAKKVQDDLNEQIQERMVSLHNAQICALQTQINPHFLYNTLEAIGNAAALLLKSENKVTEMIYTLGKLMRISLSGENYLVPIKEELEHVKLYVELMEFRFRDRIQLQMEIPEEMYKERIVKLTLQPLIENSIEHGLGRKRSQGCIWVKGEIKGEDIFLYVIDNGVGVSEKQLYSLQEKLRVSTINDSRHIGLRNVNQRLKLVFGDECGVSVTKAKEGGLMVVVRLKRNGIKTPLSSF